MLRSRVLLSPCTRLQAAAQKQRCKCKLHLAVQASAEEHARAIYKGSCVRSMDRQKASLLHNRADASCLQMPINLDDEQLRRAGDKLPATEGEREGEGGPGGGSEDGSGPVCDRGVVWHACGCAPSPVTPIPFSFECSHIKGSCYCCGGSRCCCLFFPIIAAQLLRL